MRLAQGSSPYPKCDDGPAMAETAETISVDGGGDQRREATGNKEDDLEKPVKEQLIKSHALKKMEELFRRWKNEMKKFVDKEETP